MARRGVRYYRTVPPPEGEWEQDYAAIARAGFELVVVPVPWALARSDEDGLDLSPLLRQLELARKHGLGLVVAPDLLSAPEGLDDKTSRTQGAAFLRALAAAAAPHDSLAAYDLSAVGAFHHIPRHGATLSEVRHGHEEAAARLRWCVEAIRQADARRPVFAAGHCPGWQAAGHAGILAAETTDWGTLEWDCLLHRTLDRSRAAAGGRRVWVVGLPARTAAQVRLEAWSALVAGEHTHVYEAWRPELHAGADAPPALALPDGSPSPRLREIERLDALLARTPDLAAARPCPAEAAVVVLAECTDFWASSVNAQSGYWDALLDAQGALGSRGAQVELAPPEALAAYPVAYLPMPFAVSAATADALRRYVEAGGCLVAEAGLARFDEWTRTARETPLHGLAQVFGARALDVPEMLSRDPMPTFAGRRGPYPCCGYREPLEATTGRVKATFGDGTAAIVEHAFGSGATRLIGTHPSQGCEGNGDKRYAQVILDSLAFARVKQRVLCTSPEVCARILEGEEGVRFLCALNTGSAALEAKVRVSREVGRFRRALDLAAGKELRLLNNGLRLRLAASDGVVLRLDAGSRLPRLPRWRRGNRERL